MTTSTKGLEFLIIAQESLGRLLASESSKNVMLVPLVAVVVAPPRPRQKAGASVA